VSTTVTEAAKQVVVLGRWEKTADGREVFRVPWLAVDVLKSAIEEQENPTLRLAPEPLPAGIGGNAR
jgi:hypothetical protein